MEYRKGAHTVYNIQYHFVWVTKYRYHVLVGEVKQRTREVGSSGIYATGSQYTERTC